MLHVFVETTWIVDCAAPAHYKAPTALNLLRRAQEGDLKLHLPAVCLTEARGPLQRKFQPHHEANRLRQFLKWAEGRQMLIAPDAAIVRTCLDQLENAVRNDLRTLDLTLQEIAASPGAGGFPDE